LSNRGLSAGILAVLAILSAGLPARASEILADATGTYTLHQSSDSPTEESSINIHAGPAALTAFISGADPTGWYGFYEGRSAASLDITSLAPGARVELNLPYLSVYVLQPISLYIILGGREGPLAGDFFTAPHGEMYFDRLDLSWWDTPSLYTRDVTDLVNAALLRGDTNLTVEIRMERAYSPVSEVVVFDAPTLDSTAVVCEPASASLLGLGALTLAGLGWGRRRPGPGPIGGARRDFEIREGSGRGDRPWSRLLD
jgi:hypothetical protein